MVEQAFRRLAVPFTSGAARAARSELVRALRASKVHQNVIDDASVVVSELVTNVVRHASPQRDGHVGVEWSVDTRRLWVRVSDGGRRERTSRAHHLEAVGGRGLSIVAALADSWDYERRDTGTTVTAVFDLA